MKAYVIGFVIGVLVAAGMIWSSGFGFHRGLPELLFVLFVCACCGELGGVCCAGIVSDLK